MHPEISRPRNTEAQRWPELLRWGQRDIAARLERADRERGFGRQAYLDWLATEAGVCELCAEAMDAVGDWHGRQPGLQASARAWAVDLREMARLATADVRTLGEAASPSLPLLDEWRVFLAGASGSQRVGEALGAIVMHTRLLPGEADTALVALRSMPFARSASHYLTRRAQAETDAVRGDRDRLLDAYASAALAVGAQRAASWALDAVAIAQGPSPSRGEHACG